MKDEKITDINAAVAEKPAEEQILPEEKLDRSGKMKEIGGKKLPQKQYDGLSERDGDGTREYSSRFYGEAKAKRRGSKSGGFTKALIIYAAVFFAVVCVLAAAAWAYLKTAVPSTADYQIKNAVETYTAEDWRQFLRKYLPESYAEYENSGDLAYKVLSPIFEVENASFLPVSGTEGQYMLFSDGRHFADVTYRRTDGGTPGLGEWTLSSAVFDLSFFDELDMPTTTVIIPSGAVYTVNGVENPAPAAAEYATVYPGRSKGESDALENCTTLIFNDIYYAPAITASLDGQELVLHADEEKRSYWFEYPESYMHTLTVTVPAEATVRVGGTLLDEGWAVKSSALAEKSGQDAGGSEDRVLLSVWTVKGLFMDTSVTAAVGKSALTLKSSDNANYVFNIPGECTYSLSVTVPSGCVLKINGTEADKANRSEKPLTADELSDGSTLFGSFCATELDSVPGAVPAFYRYTFTGYLARPVVEAEWNGTKLEPVSSSADGYNLVFEYDICTVPGDDADSSAITSSALNFFRLWAAYVSGGGAVENSANSEAFESNYSALLAACRGGSCAVRSVMESYREVNLLPAYEGFEIADFSLELPGYVYGDDVRVVKLSAAILRKNAGKAVDGAAFTVDFSLLMRKTATGWCVWGFEGDGLPQK